MSRLALLALAITVLAFAAAAGFFYAYSISVMVGLDAAPAKAAIEAMQGINREVTNVWFALSFFGAPLYALIALLLCLLTKNRAAAAWVFMAFAIYMSGTFGVTVSQNVPRNEALALVNATDTSADLETIWTTYSSQWTAWNHIRTLSSLAAVLFTALAFRAAKPA
ncbi:MAG: anthrone oxygenase family protein [Pseudomonadota bacterium]